MMISTYIVDDEPHAIDVLRKYIALTPDLQLRGYALAPQQALAEISSADPPMLTFVDVDMPVLSGIELAGLIHPYTQVAFTTSYREYGVEAFEKNVLDYLLKPFSYERFLTCVQKFREKQADAVQRPADLPASVFINGGVRDKLVKVELADLMYVKGEQNYVGLHMGRGSMLAYLTLQELLDRLPPGQFVRIHKSYVVNTAKIRMIEGGRVTLENQTVLPLGRGYRRGFLERMQGQILNSRRSSPD